MSGTLIYNKMKLKRLMNYYKITGMLYLHKQKNKKTQISIANNIPITFILRTINANSWF